jgi:hypothetical protein
MNLFVQAEELARFLDLRPKVIVAAGDALADGCLEGADASLFYTWVFTLENANTGVLRPLIETIPEGKRLLVRNPPAAAYVLAALSAAGADSLELLRTWWTANGPIPAVPVLNCRDRDSAMAEILRVLLGQAQEEVRETAAQATAAQAQIYALRCEYDQTRVIVESLQCEMKRLRQRPQLLTVSLPPNGHVYTPRGGCAILVQPLPISAEGMAGIDLHFPPHAPISADAQVVVRVHALDTGRDLGAWRLLAPQLGKGWVRCWLPEVLGVASHNVEVRVEWLGTGAAISLASAGDWDEMCARLEGASGPLDGCLALTAWAGGVPGMPLTSDQIGWLGQSNSGLEYTLSPEEIGRMILRVPSLPCKPTEWYPFQQRSDGSFMLHPLGSSATTLLLPDGCPIGTDRVTAVVQITSPNARGDVEYALAASCADEAGALMDNTDLASDPRFLAFSGWHTIPRAAAPHVITLDFAKPLTRPAHLVLATRMPSGVDHAWAWADWLEVRVRVPEPGLLAPLFEVTELIGQVRAA